MLSTQPVTWAGSLLSAALYPRYLGDDGLGRLAIALTVAGFVGLLASLGLQNFLTRKVANEPGPAASYLWGAVVISTLSSLLITVVLLVAAAAHPITAIDGRLMVLALIGVPVAGAQGLLAAVLVGLGRFGRYAWSTAGAMTLMTGASLAVLALGGDVYLLVATGLVCTTVTTVATWWVSGIGGFNRAAVAPDLLRELAIGGSPFLGWTLALRVRGEVDVVLTGILLQASVAGWLVAAYRIVNVCAFIPTVITTPLLPALTQAKGDMNEYRSLLKESLGTVIFLIVPAAASILALAALIPTALGWPETLQHAVPVMMVLAFQQPLVAVDMVLGTSLVALGLERRWLRVAVVGAFFNPLVNIAVIPLAQALIDNGAIGAAVVELSTELLFLGGALYLTPRGLLGRADISRAARTLGAGAALVAVVSLLQPMGIVTAFVGGGVAYLVSAIALGVFGPRQLRAVRLALRAT